MERSRIEELKSNAEQRCSELFTRVTELQAELERTRGEFRAYDSLLLLWSEDKPSEVALDMFDVNPPVKKGKKNV